MKEIKASEVGDWVKIVVLLCVTVLAVLATYSFIHNISLARKVMETISDPNVLMVGKYTSSDFINHPLLLSINTTDFSINKVDLNKINISDITGIHEARVFMINNQYKIALGTYIKGKLIILGSGDPYFNNLNVEFEDAFDGDERVRAVFTGDIDGDGQEEVVVGTRPSGIVKYYKYANGAWSGSVIDTIGKTIHDVIVTDSDMDGTKEIFVTTSTTYEYKSHKQQIEIPKIIEYKLSGNTWDKKVVWKLENPKVKGEFLYDHTRYIFSGDFDGDGKPELVSGVVGGLALRGLLMLKWNGSVYSQYSEDIEDGITLNTDVITSGDIDNNGKDEILVPTITGDAMLLYKWQGSKWERSVIAKDLIDENSGSINIIAIAIVDSTSGGYKKILYVTAGTELASDINPKFYVLAYNSAKKIWERTLVNSPNFPGTDSWGIFPMSPWKISLHSKTPIN